MVSKERLEQIARGDWKAVRRGEFDAIAKELLAWRKAAEEPVGYATERGIDYEVWNSGSTVLFGQNEGGEMLPLLRKPDLTGGDDADH